MNKLTILQDKKFRLHFLGIGGAGMSGLAELAHNMGHIVSGSDIKSSAITNKLLALGIKIFIGHDAANVLDADIVVYSGAIKPANPEFQMSLTSGKILLHRAQFLGQITRYGKMIAISGTHGKSTTTSMVAHILESCLADPTFVIGGLIDYQGQKVSSKLGSPLVVVEADESDASFKYLSPYHVIITNINEEHMETYDYNVENLKQTYLKFIESIPFYGSAILCRESKLINEILPTIKRSVITYGFENADFVASNIKTFDLKMQFDLIKNGQFVATFVLNCAGRHNILNALGSIAVAMLEGLPLEGIQQSLLTFSPVYRRFNVHTKNDLVIIDDYGHHPEEILKTYETIVESYPGKKVISVFQPHRYTRTKNLLAGFINTLSKFDTSILLPIYSAGEDPIDTINSQNLSRQLTNTAYACENFSNVLELLSSISSNDEVILFQGAGDITELAQQFLNKISAND